MLKTIMQEALQVEALEAGEAPEAAAPQPAPKAGLGGSLQRGLDWVAGLFGRHAGAGLTQVCRKA